MRTHNRILITLLTLLSLALIGGLIYQNTLLNNERTNKSALSTQLTSTEQSLGDTTNSFESLSAVYATLEQEHALCTENNATLLSELESERAKNDDFEAQIKKISGTVGKLDKLSKIDPKLLQKYSKVYFLNEHYVPEKVCSVPKEFLTRPDDVPEYVDAKMLPFLLDMLQDALDDGIELLVLSAYRSFDEQADLKSAYTVQYGSGANTFSADQGYSEHQLGTTVDFTTRALGGLTGFEQTEAFAWLQKYAHRYGFILSYPENNGYYIYEPWHWRFVGEKLADDLHDDEQYFYDLDQRTIDTYLINIFD